MRGRTAVVLSALGLCLAGCGDSGEEGMSITVDLPHTVVLVAERGLVVPTGEVLQTANFKESDLVTYRSSGVKISSGCPVHSADCRPLHICRASLQSRPTQYVGLDDVCAETPVEGEGSEILEASEGMGFTVELNTMGGVARFWIQSVEGMGSSAKVTLVYDILASE